MTQNYILCCDQGREKQIKGHQHQKKTLACREAFMALHHIFSTWRELKGTLSSFLTTRLQ